MTGPGERTMRGRAVGWVIAFGGGPALWWLLLGMPGVRWHPW